MKYTKFKIKNFKGIKELELNLNTDRGKIFPLVGLNESGKTTILEAIRFLQEDYPKGKEFELIHKKDAGNFTGDISITAELLLEDEDKGIIEELIKRYSKYQMPVVIHIQKIYSFKKAQFEHKFKFYFLHLEVKDKGKRSFKSLLEIDNKLYGQIEDEIKKRVPKILYFSDFLFDFPEKIYLNEIQNEQETQKEYRKVIDDILHSINENYSVEDFSTKLKALNSPSQKQASDAIKHEIISALNDFIIERWEKVFSDKKKKEIDVISGNDNIGYYLQIKIKEGKYPFFLHERSLGFRWFFSFILFTEFRKARVNEDGEYLFLLDEPASNLHESSQQKLLKIFEQLVDKAKIVYSTHSPYLVNPSFILNSFVVKDSGRDGKDDNEFNFSQNITAIPYRQFVAKYSDEETHFKPLLDVLDFKATDFDLEDKIIFLEGKSDYYTFKWIKEIFFNKDDDLKFYPGAGVDKYTDIFREYLAHNKKFIAVFDADQGGEKAKENYIKDISQELEKHVFTLRDIDPGFNKRNTECLFTEEDKESITRHSFPDETGFDKEKFNASIQALFIEKGKVDLSEETKVNFKKILDFIKEKFDQLKD